MAADRAGIEPEVEMAGQLAGELAIEHGLCIDHGIALVVADDDRVAGVAQAAMGDADFDSR